MPLGPKMAWPGGSHVLHRIIYVKYEKILSESTSPTALVFGIEHHQLELLQVCSYYAPGLLTPHGGHMFYILGLHSLRENMNETTRPRALILVCFICSITYAFLPCLFKLCRWGQKWLHSRGHTGLYKIIFRNI